MAPGIALVLEDNTGCRSLLTEILTEMQLQVKAFSDPVTYLNTRFEGDCASSCPCVGFILTDNDMPGMSGLEFLEKLANDGCKLPDERKAILSGNWSDETLARAQQLGCRVFFKPYSVAEICAWIDAHAEDVA